MTRILILGGTKEAAELAAKLCSEGHDVETSLAGRTKEPEPLIGNVRIGGFGGSAGLAEYLKANKIDLLIDATHPFAKQISKNAREAALLANVNFQSQTRAPWLQVEGDVWKEVSSLDEAKKAIPEKARVLLALGSQHIDQLSILENIFFLIRMVDRPEKDLPFKNHALLLGKPSNDWRKEMEILTKHKISHIVCRNSGGPGAYAKIEAARHLGIEVIIVTR